MAMRYLLPVVLALVALALAPGPEAGYPVGVALDGEAHMNTSSPSIRWIAGFAGLWIGLTLVQEAGAPEIAAMLGVLIASSVILVEGPKALDEINKVVG